MKRPTAEELVACFSRGELHPWLQFFDGGEGRQSFAAADQIPGLPVFTNADVVEYHDGPLIIVLWDDAGRPWLDVAWDADRKEGWQETMLVQHSPERLAQIFLGEVPWREWANPADGKVWVLRDHKGQPLTVRCIGPADIPADGLPDPDYRWTDSEDEE